MAKMKVEHEVALPREELAGWLESLAEAIRKGGAAELPLAGPVITLPLGEEIRCEVEVELEDDEVEMELELSWSTRRAEATASGDG